MAIYRILCHPDAFLREKASDVRKVTPQIEKLVQNMLDTMYDANGVGLAAPQIGVSKRVVVLGPGEEVLVLINPRIITATGEPEIGEEGCLSVPDVWGLVRRSPTVVVEGWNLQGKEFSFEAEGLMARAIQHEIDHLDGILFIDRAEKLLKKE